MKTRLTPLIALHSCHWEWKRFAGGNAWVSRHDRRAWPTGQRLAGRCPKWGGVANDGIDARQRSHQGRPNLTARIDTGPRPAQSIKQAMT